jgi:hypothetical protein
MPVSSSASGTVTSDGSVQTLATKTQPGTYVLAVDFATMVALDIVELTLWTKILSGGTSRVAYRGLFGPIPPSELNVYSLPVPVDIEIVAKFQKITGSASGFPWSLLLL